MRSKVIHKSVSQGSRALQEPDLVDAVLRPPPEGALHPAVRKVVVRHAATRGVSAQTIDERLTLAHIEGLPHPAKADSDALLSVEHEITSAPSLGRHSVAEIDLHEAPRSSAVAASFVPDPEVHVAPISA